MSLLARYYYKKYMVRTLTDRMNNVEDMMDNIVSEAGRMRSLLSSNETYESAAYGLFASSGELCEATSES